MTTKKSGSPAGLLLLICILVPSAADEAGITLRSQPGFSFVSVAASQGKCNMSAQNVYCKFRSLEKNGSVEVTIVDHCKWDRHFPTGPAGT